MKLNEYLNKLRDQNNIKDDIISTSKDEETIAVDLDGTLAFYDEFKGFDVIGKPIPKMMNRVKNWLSQGKKVVIFTARAHSGDKAIIPIKRWLKDNGLPDLEVTNIKTPDIIEIWDDRAVRVKQNTGSIYEPT